MKILRQILAWFKGLFSPRKRGSWKVVLLCVLAATTFWFFNALNKTYSTKIDYPIQFDYNSLGLVNVAPLPEQVRLNVSGGGWNLLKKTIWFDQSALTIPLEKPVETRYIIGSSLYPMISEQLNDLQVNYVVTDTLYLHIEELMRRAIPVGVDSAAITLEPGYRIVSKVAFKPDTLEFEGPVSLVEALPEPLMVYLPEEAVDEDFKQKIKLTEPYVHKLLKTSDDGVTVSFKTQLFDRMSRIADIRFVNFPDDSTWQATDSIGTLTFYIQQNYLERLISANFELTANWDSIQWADSTIRLDVTKAPDYIVDLTVDPPYIEVEKHENE